MTAESPETRSEYDYTAGSYVGQDRPHGAGPAAGGHPLRAEVNGYLLGFAIAILLTIGSFWMARTDLVYGPALAVGLLVLAVAQMGVHLVFFLHITTDPDNANNVLALAFGLLMVCLVVFGSIWVMTHLNQNMTQQSMDELMRMQG